MTDRPWTPGNACAAILGNAVALALALVAWVGASGKVSRGLGMMDSAWGVTWR